MDTAKNNAETAVAAIKTKAEKAAEALAEAFADVYCNGSKASKESKAIVDVMNSYLKK